MNVERQLIETVRDKLSFDEVSQILKDTSREAGQRLSDHWKSLIQGEEPENFKTYHITKVIPGEDTRELETQINSYHLFNKYKGDAADIKTHIHTFIDYMNGFIIQDNIINHKYRRLWRDCMYVVFQERYANQGLSDIKDVSQIQEYSYFMYLLVNNRLRLCRINSVTDAISTLYESYEIHALEKPYQYGREVFVKLNELNTTDLEKILLFDEDTYKLYDRMPVREKMPIVKATTDIARAAVNILIK